MMIYGCDNIQLIVLTIKLKSVTTTKLFLSTYSNRQQVDHIS